MSAPKPELAEQITLPQDLRAPLRIAGRTHVGCVRDGNQDSHWIDAQGRFALVADGMGGHQGGEVASAVATRVICEALAEQEVLKPGLAERVLGTAFERATWAIARRAQENPDLSTMGTTLTCAAWLENRELLVGHVGDSRMYRLRGGLLEQLTQDHNVLGDLLRAGLISPLQIEQNAHLGNLLTRVLSACNPCRPDMMRVTPAPGDRYLLCSDGLHDVIPRELLLELLESDMDEGDISQALVDAALDHGAPDNVTAVVISALDFEPAPQ